MPPFDGFTRTRGQNGRKTKGTPAIRCHNVPFQRRSPRGVGPWCHGVRTGRRTSGQHLPGPASWSMAARLHFNAWNVVAVHCCDGASWRLTASLAWTDRGARHISSICASDQYANNASAHFTYKPPYQTRYRPGSPRLSAHKHHALLRRYGSRSPSHEYIFVYPPILTCIVPISPPSRHRSSPYVMQKYCRDRKAIDFSNRRVTERKHRGQPPTPSPTVTPRSAGTSGA